MLGLNGGLIGARRTPSIGAAVGVWTLNEQVINQRLTQWPTMSDPFFSSVSLLLHMDGSDGSTTFTDSSLDGVTVTANGNVQLSTAQSRFGGASALFDGSGDWLNTGASASPQSGDYTVECFIRPLAVTGSDRVIYDCRSTADPTSSGFVLFIDSSARLQVFGSNTLRERSTASVLADSWQHIALVSSSGTVTYYIDGSSAGSFSASTSAALNTRIGARQDGLFAYSGNIDEFRITLGVARYTTNFTPPTVPFADA